MKLLVSLVVLIVGINLAKGHSLAKIKLQNPSDVVYKVEEDKDTNSITIVNQKPEQPTLREIIYYHIIEKAFGSKEEVREGPDFDDSRRPFTNGHGYQYLAYDPEDEFQEEITSTPEEVITEVTPREITTEAISKDSTVATEIPSKRLKRETKTPNQDNSASDDVSDQSGYSWVPGDIYDDSGDSEYTSYEPASQSREDYHVSVGNSNEEDLSQSNEDSNSTNEDAGISNKVSSESDEVWPSSNEVEIDSNETSEESIEDFNNGEAGYESNEYSNEFDHIFSDINDVFTDNDNTLPGDIQHVNVLNILKDIFDDIVNKQTDKPILIMDSEEGNKKSSILKILHGLFTNIIKNDITITNNNMVTAKPELVSNKDKDGTTGGNNPAGTDIPFINTETPITTEIVEVPYTTSYINTESTAGFNEYTDLTTEDTTIDIRNIVTGTDSINDGITTGIDISTSIPYIDGNVHGTGKETTVTEDPGHELNNNYEKPLIDTNIECKPVQDDDKPVVNKLDVMAELMNNEKFWTFMGDLAGKYLEQVMARTGLFIKHEIENQLKEQLQAKKEETSKEDTKEDNKVLPLDSDKVTNVYVFYLNKNSEKVMEEVKKIVKGNNGTNIFTFGIDSIKDNTSKDTDNESDVTAAPGADFTDNPNTVLMEETTANILNSEPTTGVVETTANDMLPVTTDNFFITDVTDTNGGGLNEWQDHITTESEFETIATESPLTAATNTVTDKTTTDITDITTINNDITEEITPVTENTMITTAENEITVTVTVADSYEVTTESGSVTTSADDTQVVINITVNVPVTESTTKAEIELTSEHITAVTDSETVTDTTGNIDTTTANSDIITEITTENDIPTETFENDITTVNSEIIRSTDSQTFTTQSGSGEVTTDSVTVTVSSISNPDENIVTTTETPEMLTFNTEAIAYDEPTTWVSVTTTSSPDDSNNIDVTTVNDNVTEENNVSDEPTTSSDDIDLNTEETDEYKDSVENKPDYNEITTEDSTSDGEITTHANEVDSTEVTADRDDENNPINSDENVASKENISDKDTTSNEVDKDDSSSEDSTSKPDENVTTDVTNSGIDSSEHNEGINSDSHLEGNSDDSTEADSN